MKKKTLSFEVFTKIQDKAKFQYGKDNHLLRGAYLNGAVEMALRPENFGLDPREKGELLVSDILNLIMEEKLRQDGLWGDQRELFAEKWLTILMEEVGEVAKACLGLAPGPNQCTTDEETEKAWQNMKEETVQVAAVCIQMLISFHLTEENMLNENR